MATLENNSIENVHTVHKSITVLLFKGLIGFLIVVVVYLIGGFFISSAGSTSLSTTPAVQNLANFWPSITASVSVLFLYGILILYITLDWINNFYILDSKAVVTRRGIIFSKEGSYDMAGIESVEVSQGLFGKIFNFGTLILFNPILERDLKLNFIPDPYAEGKFIQSMHPNPDIIHLVPRSREKK